MNMKYLLTLLLISSVSWAQQTSIYPVPRDVNNMPIPTSLGLPVFANQTLTTASYVAVLTLPTTGVNYGRQFSSICVKNPDATRTIFVCFDGASSCSTDMLKVPPSLGLCLDKLYFGRLNDITTIWAKLDATGSVSADFTVW